MPDDVTALWNLGGISPMIQERWLWIYEYIKENGPVHTQDSAFFAAYCERWNVKPVTLRGFTFNQTAADYLRYMWHRAIIISTHKRGPTGRRVYHFELPAKVPA